MSSLTLQVSGLEQAVQRMERVQPKAVRDALWTTVERETFELQRHIVQDLLSGQVLHRRSGQGSRSITARVEEAPGVIRGRVGTNLRYMLAHEYGATIHHPGSVARTAKALRFIVGGKVVFAARTKPHIIRLPERSFLRRGLADRRESFVAAVRATLVALLAQ